MNHTNIFKETVSTEAMQGTDISIDYLYGMEHNLSPCPNAEEISNFWQTVADLKLPQCFMFDRVKNLAVLEEWSQSTCAQEHMTARVISYQLLDQLPIITDASIIDDIRILIKILARKDAAPDFEKFMADMPILPVAFRNKLMNQGDFETDITAILIEQGYKHDVIDAFGLVSQDTIRVNNDILRVVNTHNQSLLKVNGQTNLAEKYLSAAIHNGLITDKNHDIIKLITVLAAFSQTTKISIILSLQLERSEYIDKLLALMTAHQSDKAIQDIYQLTHFITTCYIANDALHPQKIMNAVKQWQHNMTLLNSSVRERCEADLILYCQTEQLNSYQRTVQRTGDILLAPIGLIFNHNEDLKNIIEKALGLYIGKIFNGHQTFDKQQITAYISDLSQEDVIHHIHSNQIIIRQAVLSHDREAHTFQKALHNIAGLFEVLAATPILLNNALPLLFNIIFPEPCSMEDKRFIEHAHYWQFAGELAICLENSTNYIPDNNIYTFMQALEYQEHQIMIDDRYDIATALDIWQELKDTHQHHDIIPLLVHPAIADNAYTMEAHYTTMVRAQLTKDWKTGYNIIAAINDVLKTTKAREIDSMQALLFVLGPACLLQKHHNSQFLTDLLHSSLRQKLQNAFNELQSNYTHIWQAYDMAISPETPNWSDVFAITMIE